MSNAIDIEKLTWEKDPILSRFSFEFYKKIRTHPSYHIVYTMIIQGVDEYRIIEELLKMNENLIRDIVKLQRNL